MVSQVCDNLSEGVRQALMLLFFPLYYFRDPDLILGEVSHVFRAGPVVQSSGFRESYIHLPSNH